MSNLIISSYYLRQTQFIGNKRGWVVVFGTMIFSFIIIASQGLLLLPSFFFLFFLVLHVVFDKKKS